MDTLKLQKLNTDSQKEIAEALKRLLGTYAPKDGTTTQSDAADVVLTLCHVFLVTAVALLDRTRTQQLSDIRINERAVKLMGLLIDEFGPDVDPASN